MATRTRDPLRNFAYRVTIGGFSGSFGFSSVDGLNTSLEVVEYREGGDNHTPRKMPGQTSFDNITLERGKYSGEDSDDFLVWAQEGYKHSLGTRQLNDGFRRDFTVTIMDRNGVEVKQFTIHNGWVCEYQHDALEGDGNDVWIQRIEVCHEGLEEIDLAV